MASPYPELNNPDLIEDLYHNKDNSALEIAKFIGCHSSSVYRAMKRHGIRRKKQPVYKQLRDRKWLHQAYWGDKNSTLGVAGNLGCHKKTVQTWMDIHKIPRRNMSAAVTLAAKKSGNRHYSEISQEFCWYLYEELGKQDMLDLDTKVYFQELNNEYSIKGETSFLCDFTIIKPEGKCIIEFNGNHWHAHPDEYEAEDKIIGEKRAKDVWERDERKKRTAEDNGFKFMKVWEEAWKNNKDKVIDNCVKKLKRVFSDRI